MTYVYGPCLCGSGNKNVITKIGISASELRYSVNNPSLIKIPYQNARSLILGAIDFAKALGIHPLPSWNQLASSFIEADKSYEKKFTFGKNGTLFYFQGPYDHENYDVEEILTKVQTANGHFISNIL